MKIKKVAQTPGVLATVSTSKIDSDKDTYSCNYLNDNAVVVSPTEPSDGNVWIQRSRNLFDKNNANIFNGLIDDSSLTWFSNANGCFVILEVKPNTTYTISKKIALSEFSVASATDEPYIGMVVTKMISGSGKTEVSITTGENDKYLHIYVYYNTVSSGTLEENLNSLEVEEGSSITPKKIHTKNDNNEYEEVYSEENKEVYSTGEQRIGTWIDGKPIYRIAGIYSETIEADTLTILASVGSDIIDKVTRYEVLSRINITVNNRSHEAPVYTSTGNFCIKPSSSIHEAIFVAEYTKTTD